jgi:hypothetical protein
MRLKTTLATLIFTSFTATAQAVDDKVLHFGVSAALGYAAESYLHFNTEMEEKNRLICGTAIAIIPGLIKEIEDNADSTLKCNFFSE